VRAALALAGLAALLLPLAASAGAAGVGRPRVALSVSPARLALSPPGSSTITVRNDGDQRVAVDVTRRSVDAVAAAGAWLRVVPARLVLRPGASATLTVRGKRPRRAEPGDHQLLVLLTTRALRGNRVTVQLRLGVRIQMHVPGAVVRRLAFGELRVRRMHKAWQLLVMVANRGNVTLPLRDHVTAFLVRRGKHVARLSARARRALRPGARAVLALRYGGRAGGTITAVVRVRLGVRAVERRYRLRL